MQSKPKILIYAYRDWSFANIFPVLASMYPNWNWHRWYIESKEFCPDFGSYNIIITCEPHIEGWRETYKHIKDSKYRGKIIALQQSLYWSDEINPNAVWPFDIFFVWGRQMYEVCEIYGIQNRTLITGNPRFDKFFNMQTKDGDFTLILGSGGEKDSKTYLSFPHRRVIFQKHPNVIGDKMPEGTENLIANSSEVIFRTTGAGIIAMIMNKPVMILKSLPGTQWGRSYEKSILYNSGKFGFDPDFVRWAVSSSSNATEKVRDAIYENI